MIDSGIDKDGYYRINPFGGEKERVTAETAESVHAVRQTGIHLGLFHRCHGGSQIKYRVYRKTGFHGAEKQYAEVPNEYLLCPRCMFVAPVNISGCLEHVGVVINTYLREEGRLD